MSRKKWQLHSRWVGRNFCVCPPQLYWLPDAFLAAGDKLRKAGEDSQW